MAIYSPKYQGFIADAADIDFVRCDGQVYHCKHANATNMTGNSNAITITGGRSQFPIGYIDTDRTLEISFTNAEFDGDMFEIANSKVVATDGDSYTLETALYKVVSSDSALKISLPFMVDSDSVYIRGLENAASLAAGSFTVTPVASAGDNPASTTLTFNSADVSANDEVWVSYKRRIAGAHDIMTKTSSTTARGQLFLHWPVYSNGTDCTEAAIKGWLHLCVYRCRVTALPDIQSSYKTAATHSMTFSAMDPQMAGDKMYRLTYEPLTADGEIDTAYATATNVDYEAMN